MFILAVYDVHGTEESDKKRLRKVAKICEKYGIRVQSSVFEINTTPKDYISIKAELEKIISAEDSIRFYKLPNNFSDNIEIIGKVNDIELKSDNTFIF